VLSSIIFSWIVFQTQSLSAFVYAYIVVLFSLQNKCLGCGIGQAMTVWLKRVQKYFGSTETSTSISRRPMTGGRCAEQRPIFEPRFLIFSDWEN
jgi:hypothetical protein